MPKPLQRNLDATTTPYRSSTLSLMHTPSPDQTSQISVLLLIQQAVSLWSGSPAASCSFKVRTNRGNMFPRIVRVDVHSTDQDYTFHEPTCMFTNTFTSCRSLQVTLSYAKTINALPRYLLRTVMIPTVPIMEFFRTSPTHSFASQMIGKP